MNGENEYTSLPPFMIKSVKIPIPVDSEGNIDLAAQEEVANKYFSKPYISVVVKADSSMVK